MNILIVDDEVSALRDLARVIGKVAPDEAIQTAGDSKSALAFCRDNAPDVVFLDIRMPDMDGLTLAAEMKKLCPLVNIIMVTAYSDYALDALKLYVSDYILKPAMPEDVKNALLNLRHPVRKSGEGLFVQCFGNFEVFYDGEPVRFTRSKAKELFAYLIDRKGASVTNAQLRAILWMDETSDYVKQGHYLAQIVHELQGILNELNLSDIFLHRRNAYAIVPDMIPCDFYQALAHDPRALSMYHGEYMGQYPWAAYRNLTNEKELFL